MKKAVVIGESCTDVFVYGTAKRLAPEAPAPVFLPENQTCNTGMAGNVYRNLLQLGVDCSLLTNQTYEKVTKTRFVDTITNTLFLRVDQGEDNIEPLYVNQDFKDFDIVVIIDYDKGFMSKSTIRKIIDNHPCVFIDTKKRLGDWCADAGLIKINSVEYEISRDYIESNIPSKVIRTAGKYGCFYRGKNYEVPKVEIKDLSGAGDTFTAGLVAKWLETENIEESIIFANECATVAVQRRGVCQDFSGSNIDF